MRNSRLSRYSHSSPDPSPTSPGFDISERPSSSVDRPESEGYPSWLPRRPPPPAPASTFHSSIGVPEVLQIEPVGGRKPTPRSVRIVTVQQPQSRQDETRAGGELQTPVWSRASGAVIPNVLSTSNSRTTQPRFRARNLHIDLLQNPSKLMRLWFYLYPLIVFAHVPLQCFLDFNAAFILFQVSAYPTPEAPDVPSSGRNWTLATAAYVSSWLLWLIFVLVLYEIVYHFIRRWRVKRPLIMPIYLSSPAFNLASMTSYSTFCFMQHLRLSAFLSDTGSLRDGLAESFWYYSQNLPTVTLLLPRAGLSLALLLSFSSPNASVQLELADANLANRDSTFFGQDGSLTRYARGVLIANATWTAWRVLVLLISWIGLWIVSGQGCAGICGPRYRWEEEDMEKRRSTHNEAGSDTSIIPWTWRECTQTRIKDTFEFCLTSPKSTSKSNTEKQDGLEHVLAAVGFPSRSVPPQAKRGVLREDLFENPKSSGEGMAPPSELSEVRIVHVTGSKDKLEGPSNSQPIPVYPFTAHGAQVSSKDKVPFPPSSSGKTSISHESGTGQTSTSVSGTTEDDDDDDDDEDESNDVMSEQPSTTTRSMSSLGQPVHSRYPFQFRRPGRRGSSSRGNSYSSTGISRHNPSTTTGTTSNSHSHSTQSRFSQATQSTGNRESSDSQSHSHSPTSGSDHAFVRSGLPLPPRHPHSQLGASRHRADTIQVSPSPPPPPVAFPSSRIQTRSEGFTSPIVHSPLATSSNQDQGQDDPADHASVSSHHSSESTGEHEDVVGLLTLEQQQQSNPRSPKPSLFCRASNLSQPQSRRRSSRSHHSSVVSVRSRSSSSSIQVSIRSRAASLIHSIASHSSSSLALARARANSSMARLQDEPLNASRTASSSSSASGGQSSMYENNTFGVPVRRMPWARSMQEEAVQEEDISVASSTRASPLPSSLDDVTYGERGPPDSRRSGEEEPSVVTKHPTPEKAESSESASSSRSPLPSSLDDVVFTERSQPVDIPRAQPQSETLLDVDPASASGTSGGTGAEGSTAWISTAAPSFVTAAPTMLTEETMTEESIGGGAGDLMMPRGDRADGGWRTMPPV